MSDDCFLYETRGQQSEAENLDNKPSLDIVPRVAQTGASPRIITRDDQEAIRVVLGNLILEYGRAAIVVGAMETGLVEPADPTIPSVVVVTAPNKILNLLVTAVRFSESNKINSRIQTVLRDIGIKTLGDLIQNTEDDLRFSRKEFGDACIKAVQNTLSASYGLHLALKPRAAFAAKPPEIT